MWCLGDMQCSVGDEGSRLSAGSAQSGHYRLYTDVIITSKQRVDHARAVSPAETAAKISSSKMPLTFSLVVHH